MEEIERHAELAKSINPDMEPYLPQNYKKKICVLYDPNKGRAYYTLDYYMLRNNRKFKNKHGRHIPFKSKNRIWFADWDIVTDGNVSFMVFRLYFHHNSILRNTGKPDTLYEINRIIIHNEFVWEEDRKEINTKSQWGSGGSGWKNTIKEAYILWSQMPSDEQIAETMGKAMVKIWHDYTIEGSRELWFLLNHYRALPHKQFVYSNTPAEIKKDLDAVREINYILAGNNENYMVVQTTDHETRAYIGKKKLWLFTINPWTGKFTSVAHSRHLSVKDPKEYVFPGNKNCPLDCTPPENPAKIKLSGFAEIANYILKQKKYRRTKRGKNSKFPSVQECMIQTLLNAEKYPCQEQLLKIKWIRAATFLNSYEADVKKGKTIQQLLNLKNGQLKHLAESESSGSYKDWTYLYQFPLTGFSVRSMRPQCDWRPVIEAGYDAGMCPEPAIMLEVFAAFGGYTFNVLNKYFEHGKDSTHFMLAVRKTTVNAKDVKNCHLCKRYNYLNNDVESFMQVYLDYITMAEEINHDTEQQIPLFLKPSQVITEHEKIIREYNRTMDLIRCRNEQNLYDSFAAAVNEPSYQKLSSTEVDFSIVIPSSPEDLLEEGRMLGHCVGSYWRKVARGDTQIVFLRYTNDIDNPYCTIEVRGNMVLQCYNKNDTHDKNRDRIRYIKEWANEKHLAIECQI